MFKGLKFIIICIPLVFAGVCGAETDKKEEGNVDTLPEVVVTATRTVQKTERIPAGITVITQAEIENSNAGSITDILSSGEGIVVRNLQGNGKNAQVDLRGYGETGPYNTLVLVDGRRVNGIDLSGVDWTQIPIDQVERIEIVRGTGTVLYGDNAAGGVINIITKTPSDKFTAKGGITLGSYDRKRIEASVSGGYDRIAASFNASHDETEGYRKNNKYKADDFGGKIVFDPSDSLSLKLSGSFHEDDFGLPGPLTEVQMKSDRKNSTSPLDEGTSTDSYIKAGIDLMIGNYGTIVADLSYKNRSSEAFFPDSTSPLATDSSSETWGVNPKYIWNGDIFNRKNTLVTGADFYWSEQDIDSYGGFFIPLTTKTTISNIERDSVGIYLNNEYAVKENIIISLGARHEKVRYDLVQKDMTGFLGPLDEQINDSENAYNAGLAFIYAEKSSVFVRANRSFRFPLTDELVYIDWSTFAYKANTNLKPQTGIHYEAGIKHSFTERISGGVTLFRAEIENELFYNPSTFGNENHPETLHQGVEIGCRVKPIDKLTLFGNFTYEEATFEKAPYKGNDIPAVPGYKGHLGFRVDDVAITGLIFSAGYNYVGSSHVISDQANNFEKLKSYYTVDAKLAYKYKMLKAFLGVNNLTNQKYSEYGVMDTFLTKRNFYPAPERNWVAGIQVDF
ncbi:MAG: TonB-dependent receptor [Proteobacteria bacterium]|nr:TonB-dependent receptor [Pseudomonadota bacterium]MBU1713244.1 TonB-dependent receptor [Pseudomonadota bacterium]